jgi:glyoxylase-like metal-dependent hydrolase (beta-lactamase superfamily II)
MGLLPDALREAGVARDDLGTVAFTHTHIDHVHGLVDADGSDAFPKLERLLVPQEEIAMFDEIDRLARFRPRRQPFADGDILNPSIKIIAAHGHEVGHSVFEVTSAGERLLIWGDIIHVPSIQFARPEITWEFDDDQVRARSTRQRVLRLAAQPNCYVAGAHLEFPGIGTLAMRDGAFSYTAL